MAIVVAYTRMDAHPGRSDAYLSLSLSEGGLMSGTLVIRLRACVRQPNFVELNTSEC